MKKKKIYVIVGFTILLFLGAVITARIETANENNHIRRDQSFMKQNENGFPPKRQDNKYPLKNLTELTGIFQYNNDSFSIANTQLVFSPDDMIKRQASPFDYDADEIIETILGELKGLQGLNVTIKGELHPDNIFRVVEINGMPLEKPPQPPQNINRDQGDFGIRPGYINRG